MHWFPVNGDVIHGLAPVRYSLPVMARAILRRMANKRERQATILELVEQRSVSSQEELRRLLRQRGWDVTQATLSRDLRELRLARVPGSDGTSRYSVADATAEEYRAALDGLLPQFFVRADGVNELAVIRTIPGGAQPIAAALDAEGWPDLLGTLAGDDTILIICRTAAARERTVRRLQTLAGAGGQSEAFLRT